MKQNNWYSIRNVSPETAEICIYDEIGLGGVTAKSFLEDLKASGDRRILLRINSPGGDVFDGLAIYNRLREHAAGTEVRIDGLAASIASVIAMAGKPVGIAENAMMMIHNPGGVVGGEADDMREVAGVLDKVRLSLLAAYTRKTGQPEATISAMMDKGTYLSASEAKDLGFADVVTEGMRLAARFDMSRFHNFAPPPGGDPFRTALFKARAESDPQKRGALFADASRLLAAGRGASGDGRAALVRAKAEPDPLKRGRLYAEASRLITTAGNRN